MKNIIALMLTALLASCGGSEEFPTEIVLAGKKLTVDATVSIASGSIVPAGQIPPCTSLYVGGTFVAQPPPFPASVTVGAISLYRDGRRVWQGATDPSQSRLDGDGVFHAVGSACVPTGIEGGQEVVALFELSSADGVARLASKAAAVQIVY